MTDTLFSPDAITSVTVGELQLRLSMEPDEEGLPDPVGIWRSHAQAVARWRTPRRIDVLAHTRGLLAACGYGEPAWERSKSVLDWMSWRHDVEAVTVGGVAHVLPGLDRVVWCGSQGFLIGCGELYAARGAPTPDAAGPAVLARWLAHDEAQSLLAEVDEWSLEDWLGPAAWTHHANRRGFSVAALDEYWVALAEVFLQNAAGAVGAEGVRVIGGHPGDFFGKVLQGTARWRGPDGVPDGIYCGARPGYQDAHLHPALVEVVDGEPSRVMDVYDWDELRWVLLARGVATEAPERLGVGDGELRQSCELPDQIRRALACLCSGEGWTWRGPPGTARAIGSALAAVGGLSLVQV
jgi:hypothetical protein